MNNNLSFNNRYYPTLYFILAIAFIVIFAGIGLRDPWPADEPRFVEAAKEMIESGKWFFPLRGGELYPDKPPVFMWVIALLYKLTGNLSFTFLIPNAVAGLVIILCVFDLAAELWNVKTARNAAILLLIAPQFVIQAKAAQIDAMAACWITVAMYGLIRHFFIYPSQRWYVFSWVCMGLGILTKGVGFLPIFLFIPIIALHLSGRQRFDQQLTLKALFGPAALLGVLILWLLPVLYFSIVKGNPDFIAYRDNILFQQTAQRYAHPSGHLKPWYYFILSVVPLLWFPLYLFFFNKDSWRKIAQSCVMQATLVWVLCVIIFFSISPGKRGIYILPALPMMAMVIGAIVTQLGTPKWVNRVLAGVSSLIAIALVTISIMTLLHVRAITNQIGGNVFPFAMFFAAVAVLWIAVLWISRLQLNLYWFGLVLGLTWILYSTWGYVLLNPIRTPAKDIMARVSELIGPEGELGLTRFKEQFLLFSPIPTTHFSYLDGSDEQDKNAWLWMKEKPNRYILTQKGNDIVCFDINKAVDLGEAHRRDWILLGEDTLLSECSPPKSIKRYHLKPKALY
jgi:4-amino-4-deoxy-L-arabinose transferase-like glycosyltransferase